MRLTMLYKLRNGQKTGFVPGVGAIVNGQIESPTKLEGKNFELVPPEEVPQTSAPVAPPVSPPLQPQTPSVNPVPEPVQNTNTVTPGVE